MTMLARSRAAAAAAVAVVAREPRSHRRRRRRRQRFSTSHRGRCRADGRASDGDGDGDGEGDAQDRTRGRGAFAASASTSTAVNPFGKRRSTTANVVDPFATSGAGATTTKTTTKTTTTFGATRAPAAYRAFEDVEVYEVPERLRRHGATRNTSFVEYKSLEELFPRTNLSETFHRDAEFRTDIRRAMRDDLFIPDERLSAEKNAAMRSLSSSVHVNWFESPTQYASLTKTFERYGVMNVTGERFIHALGGLCRTPCHGTLIDIASIGKQKIRHSWHQDSGYERFTVMLGFPAPTPSDALPLGVGVFTHAVKLSHALAQPNAPGAVIQWENYNHDDLGTSVEFDRKYIARPVFGVGREIMVYCDAHHVHSAPDEAHRDAVWRFM